MHTGNSCWLLHTVWLSCCQQQLKPCGQLSVGAIGRGSSGFRAPHSILIGWVHDCAHFYNLSAGTALLTPESEVQTPNGQQPCSLALMQKRLPVCSLALSAVLYLVWPFSKCSSNGYAPRIRLKATAWRKLCGGFPASLEALCILILNLPGMFALKPYDREYHRLAVLHNATDDPVIEVGEPRIWRASLWAARVRSLAANHCQRSPSSDRSHSVIRGSSARNQSAFRSKPATSQYERQIQLVKSYSMHLPRRSKRV